ncbi:MAG: NYN domain-containing protein [Alphaproteobacteria bacterium]|nr:NYN domain-containing protein [Alphaproteobacteria bacterium]
MTDQSLRIAVLIDAENTSHTILDKLFAEIAGLGVATVRRAYGDFTNPSLAPWKSAVLAHSTVPMQHGNNTKGKNASDIGLVLDAMDLLHSERLNAFCIVSSDGDFTRRRSASARATFSFTGLASVRRRRRWSRPVTSLSMSTFWAAIPALRARTRLSPSLQNRCKFRSESCAMWSRLRPMRADGPILDRSGKLFRIVFPISTSATMASGH